MSETLTAPLEDTRSLEARLMSVSNDLTNASVTLSKNVNEAVRRIKQNRNS